MVGGFSSLLPPPAVAACEPSYCHGEKGTGLSTVVEKDCGGRGTQRAALSATTAALLTATHGWARGWPGRGVGRAPPHLHHGSDLRYARAPLRHPAGLLPRLDARGDRGVPPQLHHLIELPGEGSSELGGAGWASWAAAACTAAGEGGA